MSAAATLKKGERKAKPKHGAVGRRFQFKSYARTVTVVAREADHIARRFPKKGEKTNAKTSHGLACVEVRTAVWIVENVDTKRRTKVRDDNLGKDYTALSFVSVQTAVTATKAAAS